MISVMPEFSPFLVSSEQSLLKVGCFLRLIVHHVVSFFWGVPLEPSVGYGSPFVERFSDSEFPSANSVSFVLLALARPKSISLT